MIRLPLKNKRRILIVISLFFLLSAIANGAGAAKYIWPVKDAIEVTSVLCDKRNGHPHGGLDLSHFGKVGTVPLVSVADGVLMRIRSSNYGYGNALYIRMTDQIVAVYAHLDRFSPRLEKVGEDIRRKTGLARLDYYYEPEEMNVKIKQGEIIGYGGKTGTSTAHLHFELRKDDLANLNPLTNGFVLDDTVAPRIHAIRFQPADENALVNGKNEAAVFAVAQSGKLIGNNTPIRVSGRVGISVDAVDQFHAKSRRVTPYRLELFVDDNSFFTTRFETWSYLDQRVWFAQYDVGDKNRRYLRVYNPYPSDVPFFSSPDAGTFQDLKPGRHKMTLTVSDPAQNSSDAHFIVEVVPGADPDARPWPRGAGKYALYNEKGATLDNPTFEIAGLTSSFFEPVKVDITPMAVHGQNILEQCVDVSDPGVFVRHAFLVKFGFHESLPEPGQLGVYRFDATGFGFLGNTIDEKTHTVSGLTDAFGTYCLVRDTEAPTLADLKINGAKKTPVTFVVADTRSGFSPESVRTTIDGKLAITDFASGTGKASAKVYWTQKPGKHTGTITVTDRAGNTTSLNFTYITK